MLSESSVPTWGTIVLTGILDVVSDGNEVTLASDADDELFRQFHAGAISMDELLPVLVHRHEPMLYALARRYGISPDDASDLIAQMFVHAYRYIDKHRPEKSFTPWLRTVFHNLLTNHIRRQRIASYQIADDVELPDDQPTALDALLEQESVDHVRKALSELPLKDTQLLLLRYVEDKSLSAIAAELGISVSTVHYRLNRAHEHLKKILLRGRRLASEKTSA